MTTRVKILVSFLSFSLAIMPIGCDNKVQNAVEVSETNKLLAVVLDVGEQMGALGFPIDASEIKIEVKSAQDMAAIFNELSDEARQEVSNYTPSGPLTANKDEKTTFSDGDSTRLAFYDPNSKSIVFKQGSFAKLTKGYLAHELAHVYQDQKWGFSKIWRTYKDRPTREAFNVTQFIIEGHAELVRHAYEQSHVAPSDAREIGKELGKMSENDCIPCHTKQSLATLPYVFGMRFLVNQYREGGWPKVENFFNELPLSTEQIIHENKFDNDKPTELSLPVWDEEGYAVKPILNGSLGEAYLLAKLLSMPINPEIAFSAASGWDGDVAQLYRFPDGKEALVWRVIFDRVEDARQLEDAIKGADSESQPFRIGRVVDWIVTKHPEIRKKLRLFLSKHRANYEGNLADEQSTTEQEISIKNDAGLFDYPNYMPKIVIGPNL